MTNDTTSFTGWIFAGIGAIISTLASVIAFLFKLRENENSRNIAAMREDHAKTVSEIKTELTETASKAIRCEQDRQELRVECALMRQKLDTLEHKVSSIDTTGTQYSHQHPQEKQA